MAWLALTLEVDEAHADALSDALLEAGATAVSLEDADAGTAGERARFAEPGKQAQDGAWRRTRLRALLEPDADASAVVAAAAHAAGLATAPRFSRAPLEDRDWVRATQAQFSPLPVGERLWIVPSWHEPPVPNAVIVRLDPGLAFGTGSHPTTQLVLAWLERRLAGLAPGPSARVLDYGCGSGILAIAAAKLGATDVDAVDIDPQAVATTAENARRNGVALRALAADALPAGDYDLVVANILANPLIVLAPVLTARTRPGGELALSGILASQADEVRATYAPDFELAVCGEQQGWVLLAGARRATRHDGL